MLIPVNGLHNVGQGRGRKGAWRRDESSELLERAESLMARMLSGHSPRFSRSIDGSSHYQPNDEEGRFKVDERVTKADVERKVW